MRDIVVIGVATLLGTIGGIFVHDNAPAVVEFFQGLVFWLEEIAMPVVITIGIS